jgi:hypothetical protein
VTPIRSMSLPSSPTLVLELRQRRWDRRCAVFLMGAVLVAPWLLAQSISWGLLLGGSWLVFATCRFGFYRADWIGPRKLVRMTWQADGSWALTDTHGNTYIASLHASSRMSPFAVWLRWTLVDDPRSSSQLSVLGRSPSVLIGRNDISASDFRRLLVRLRMDRSEWQPLATSTPISDASARRSFS